LGSDQAVRFFLRNFAGSELKLRTPSFLIGANGFNIGMRRRIGMLALPYKEEFS